MSLRNAIAVLKAAAEDRKNQAWMLLCSLTIFVILAGVSAGMFGKIAATPMLSTIYICSEAVLVPSFCACLIELIAFTIRKFKGLPVLPKGRGKRLLLIFMNMVFLTLVQACTGAANGQSSIILELAPNPSTMRAAKFVRIFTWPAFAAAQFFSFAVNLMTDLAVPDNTNEPEVGTLESGRQDNHPPAVLPSSLTIRSLVLRVLHFILSFWAMWARLAVNLITGPAVLDSADEQEDVESGRQVNNPPAHGFVPRPIWNLAFRVLQFTFAFLAMCTMLLASDHSQLSALRSFVRLCICQWVWSGLLTIAELCAIYGYGLPLFHNHWFRKGVSLGDLVLQGNMLDAACGAVTVTFFLKDMQEPWNNIPIFEKASLLGFGSYISLLVPSLYTTVNRINV